MAEVKNPFEQEKDAERYQNFRPRYHHLPAELLIRFNSGKKFNSVLDVACGTGHSTLALKNISENLFACDRSEVMLNQAQTLIPEVNFYHCPAEKMPFPDKSFDLINISMAYQWLNQIDFLFEVKRLLKPKSYLGIDNYGFTGKMNSNSDFKNIYKLFDQNYMKSVPRNNDYPTDQQLLETGFSFNKEFKYNHTIELNKNQFIEYLKTRSNYTCLSETEKQIVDENIANYYEPVFKGLAHEFEFAGLIKIYQAN